MNPYESRMFKPLGKNTPIEKRRFIHSLLFPLFFVFVIFTIQMVQSIENLSFAHWGIYPMTMEGLKGIFTYPLIHGDWEHLYSNAISFAVLSTALFFFYNKIAYRVFFLLYFLSGVGIWLAARPSWHIGASGLIYGLTTFLIVSGVIRRHIPLIAISFCVILFYGGLIWGAFPLKYNLPYSWEGHLWGALLGIVLALIYRREGPQRPPSPFEDDEEDDDDTSEEEYWMTDKSNIT